MLLPPNEVYTAFSFVGFVMCAIPFYWHLEARNTGTCLYMAWTGLGCLVQCINSIVWNKNMIDKAPVYCDIVTRIQVALNVAISASSLCINRRLYKIASVNAVMVPPKEKHRAIMTDLSIGIGIPILQIVVQYAVSGHRYNIFEDFGPNFAIVNMPPTFVLFFAWPVAIGCVSLVYCVRTIILFRQITSSNRGHNLGRNLRLMALSSMEILGTIPLGTYFIVKNAQRVIPWKSWADTHSDYSRVVQIPAFVWKNKSLEAFGLEAYRWSLVACAFVFFAFFGFSVEARHHYRLVYRCTSSFGHSKGKDGFIVTVLTANGDMRDSTVSVIDQLSIPSISFADDLIKPDFGAELSSLPDSVGSSSSVESFEELEPRGKSLPLEAMTLAVDPASASDLPHVPDTTHATIHAYSSDAADAV